MVAFDKHFDGPVPTLLEDARKQIFRVCEKNVACPVPTLLQEARKDIFRVCNNSIHTFQRSAWELGLPLACPSAWFSRGALALFSNFVFDASICNATVPFSFLHSRSCTHPRSLSSHAGEHPGSLSSHASLRTRSSGPEAGFGRFPGTCATGPWDSLRYALPPSS